MELFIRQVVSGMGNGAIYASLALALVLIFRSTGIVNFAQGEMAMFSTYLAWQLIAWGLPLFVAFGATLVLSFGIGVALERAVIRRVAGAPELTVVIVTVGLLLAINATAALIWTSFIKPFPTAFDTRVLDVPSLGITSQTIGTLLVVGLSVGLFYLLLQKTKVGLAMRAVAVEPASSRLVGINVGRMLGLGWGAAAAVGALSGILVAPFVFLEPNMMAGVLLYAFASATLGGFDSLPGAIVGGLLVGVSESLASTYVDAIGSDLKIVVPLALIVGVLLLRPQGLFGSPLVERV